MPTWALHSTYFSCVPSIMRYGLIPGGTRGARYRRHVHLAMSYHPTAGLRKGSDVILVIDLVRAHNAGCVFYVSDNNVILTADCVPPPCIARAQCTSTGEAYDLSKLRAAYKVDSVALAMHADITLSLSCSTAWSLAQAQPAILPRCRCSSRSASGTCGLFGLAASRQRRTGVAQCSPSSGCFNKVTCCKAQPLRPLGRILDLLSACALHQTLAVHLRSPRRGGQRSPHLRYRTTRHFLRLPSSAQVALQLSRSQWCKQKAIKPSP